MCLGNKNINNQHWRVSTDSTDILNTVQNRMHDRKTMKTLRWIIAICSFFLFCNHAGAEVRTYRIWIPQDKATPNGELYLAIASSVALELNYYLSNMGIPIVYAVVWGGEHVDRELLYHNKQRDIYFHDIINKYNQTYSAWFESFSKDIVFNPYRQWTSYAGEQDPSYILMDFYRVLLHELWHSLGMDHLGKYDPSIVGDLKYRHLRQMDINLLADAYGVGAISVHPMYFDTYKVRGIRISRPTFSGGKTKLEIGGRVVSGDLLQHIKYAKVKIKVGRKTFNVRLDKKGRFVRRVSFKYKNRTKAHVLVYNKISGELVHNTDITLTKRGYSL